MKPSQIFKHCLNPRVLIGIGALISAKWCQENRRRNPEITKYSINKNENDCH